MLDLIFNFFSEYLIQVMSGLLGLGLIFRWASYRSSIREHHYFTTFTNEIEKYLSNIDPAEHNHDHDENNRNSIL